MVAMSSAKASIHHRTEIENQDNGMIWDTDTKFRLNNRNCTERDLLNVSHRLSTTLRHDALTSVVFHLFCAR